VVDSTIGWVSTFTLAWWKHLIPMFTVRDSLNATRNHENWTIDRAEWLRKPYGVLSSRKGVQSLRSSATSVLGHFGTRTEVAVQFGPWTLRSSAISVLLLSTHVHFGPRTLRSSATSVLKIGPKWPWKPGAPSVKWSHPKILAGMFIAKSILILFCKIRIRIL